MITKKILHELYANVGVGIGEVSKIIGVSPRQLRYWEQKGYIKPIEDKESGIRRYSLGTVFLICFIKDHLDQGFTLAAAYEKSKDVSVKTKIIRKFFQSAFSDVKVTDTEKAYGEIDLGNVKLSNTENYHIKGIVDEKGNYFKVEKDK
ncbi:DNA-binding transcriptional MerR regulator [Lactobacillus colini]|uniref:DNA-binding transcriptional MerR regulator n=1 Tax=Lactobacillus colini TaxID=1819254 RepID=A0ABS4MG37_9LACO|nr:MerR family transcriptional regulator [Lactobacillus colini]MBP2058657.1 DNA-binding transcriptional MerR regulator [Lactobacillus colini]